MDMYFDGEETCIKGNFEFYMGKTLVYSPLDFTPYKKVSFPLNMEIIDDIIAFYKVSREEAINILGQKLKEDFVNALTNDTFKEDLR